MDPSFTIRHMTIDDLQTVCKWAHEEGWNFGENDLEAIFHTDPNGFFVGEADGELVGSFAAVKYGDFCFWNLYIVREKYRGCGYGSKIFEHARNYCKDSRCMALDAPRDLIPNYMRYGFKGFCQTLSYKKVAQGEMSSNLINLRTVPIEKLMEYDTAIFGYSRKKLLETLLTQRSVFALGVMRENKLVGYGILRKQGNGNLISPLNADDKETAMEIYEGLQSYVVGQEVTTSIFDCNNDSIEIMDNQEWTLHATYTRMYARAAPKMDLSRLYSPVDEIS